MATMITTGIMNKNKNDGDEEVRISPRQHHDDRDRDRDDGNGNDGNNGTNENDEDDDDNTNKITTIRNCYCPNCENKKLISKSKDDDDENDNKDMDCVTMIYPTTIPGFREIVCMTTSCNNCHYKNTQVTNCGKYQLYGQKLILTIPKLSKLNEKQSDNNIPLSHFFNRQIIKSDTATIYIPTLHNGLEIPCTTQQGCITTIEGILTTTMKHLQMQQSDRLLDCNEIGDLTIFYNCQTVIQQIQTLLNLAYGEIHNEKEEEQETVVGDDENSDGDEASSSSLSSSLFPFVFIVDDPSGNSYIENPYAPKHDPYVQTIQYQRTRQQDIELLGLLQVPSQQPSQPQSLQTTNQFATKSSHDDVVVHDSNVKDDTTPNPNTNMVDDDETDEDDIIDRYKEIMIFPNTTCPNCYSTDKCETKMLPTKDIISIPHFKECILMCVSCENCGYKCNEIKSYGNGSIPSMGTKLTLFINSVQDLKRDVIKSDTCSIQLPDLDIELVHGRSIASSYTTIEGLLRNIYDQLYQHNPFHTGDSSSLSVSTLTHTTTLTTTSTTPGGSSSTRSTYYMSILDKLQEIANGNQEYMPCTLILMDPLGNSCIGPRPSSLSTSTPSLGHENSRSSDPTTNSKNIVGGATAKEDVFDINDLNLLVEEYERTHEENESLGLNDIRTEGYETTTTRSTTTSTNHQ